MVGNVVKFACLCGHSVDNMYGEIDFVALAVFIRENIFAARLALDPTLEIPGDMVYFLDLLSSSGALSQ